MLLDERAEIGAKNKDESTLLERAATNWHGEVVKLLLERC
jgi:ankyrin repeat protein